jgi:hypothetical protein
MLRIPHHNSIGCFDHQISSLFPKLLFDLNELEDGEYYGSAKYIYNYH